MVNPEAVLSPLPLKKRLTRLAGRVGLPTVVGLFRLLPLPAARWVGRSIGLLLYGVLKRYRNTAHKNLALVYPDLPKRERHRMARAVFLHFGMAVAEFVKLPQLDRSTVDQMAVVEGEEHLQQALAKQRGAFIITGHFGNWEFLARWLATHNYPLNVIARRSEDPETEKLLTNTRLQNGAHVFQRGEAVRPVLQSLRKNELVGILPDQNAGDIVVPFFGLPTGTTDGPAVLHLHTKAPLVFSWCTRREDGRFHILFEPPVVYEPTGDRAADVLAIMTLVNRHLEDQIRKNPTQWLWLHDRWRASPWVFERQEGALQQADSTAAEHLAEEKR
ncbi:lysophospholipid acyltransferase family protein [Chthonomonas calidirosea]|uniref:lysophospholipid acyltransferase family protein n=1 Tax=Chthonomonas calidirosea TaxID=454171 RepID=UPI0006ECAD20|nr:lysophospholipid acyltransferase family protein [Chthonomonas calidirosea]CEK18329.1 Lauroyl/myristoyl acyltransferase [Chthonomonas calidirosea]